MSEDNLLVEIDSLHSDIESLTDDVEACRAENRCLNEKWSEARTELSRYHAAIQAVLAKHSGLHQCTSGWFADDPSYRGTVATNGPCPTRAAIATEMGV